MELKEQLEIIKRGCDELLVEAELVDKLKRGKPLRIKAGFDPTAPDLHLGHTVLLNKLRQLQDLGHQVIFLIGDFTGMIGDPTGKNVTRPPLSRARKSRPMRRPIPTRSLRYSIATKPRSLQLEVVRPDDADGHDQAGREATPWRACSSATISPSAIKADQPIAIHEFLYPLVQGYDSVALKSDVELGGTDQKFNLLVGRELQETHGQPPQCMLTMPLLEGSRWRQQDVEIARQLHRHH